ncbi:MAG: class I SAM-dependent methyltransferase [Rhodospirillaceae bacterium]|nr:class I SAM-dependent methyltransferase [Rhodospirillaceae bacterium]
MSNRTVNLNDRLYRYLLEHSSREDALLRRLREETAKLPMAMMQISPEQGQFMNLLTEIVGARRVIEVGTFTGYSSICVARALPANGHLICCDVSEEYTSIARRYWAEAGLTDHITLKIAPALKTLDALVAAGEDGQYDLAFIDADKSNYDGYYERVLRLLRQGGVIMVDNVLWGGAVADPAVTDEDTAAIRRLNDKLHKDERISMSLVPIGDGVTLARKR